MKTQVRGWGNDTEHGSMLYMWCPGCDDLHQIEIDQARPTAWHWDGNEGSPTISPSILVGGTQWQEGHEFHKGSHTVSVGERTTCHSFVRNGRWEFLGDCTHHLAGQTVDMVDLPDWFGGGPR